jgi:flagellar basal body rod protein FlgC
MAVFSQIWSGGQKMPKAADKTGMQILAIAQQGLQQAQNQVNKAAQGIAQTSMNGATPQASSDTVSLSDQMVSLMSASNQYDASLGLAQTAKEMEKQTLNLLA